MNLTVLAIVRRSTGACLIPVLCFAYLCLGGETKIASAQANLVPVIYVPGFNPFFDVAALPSGIGSYFWDTELRDYVSRDTIGIGGANWVYSNTTSTLTLTAL
jgi:hypothetical protein